MPDDRAVDGMVGVRSGIRRQAVVVAGIEKMAGVAARPCPDEVEAESAVGLGEHQDAAVPGRNAAAGQPQVVALDAPVLQREVASRRVGKGRDHQVGRGAQRPVEAVRRDDVHRIDPGGIDETGLPPGVGTHRHGSLAAPGLVRLPAPAAGRHQVPVIQVRIQVGKVKCGVADLVGDDAHGRVMVAVALAPCEIRAAVLTRDPDAVEHHGVSGLKVRAVTPDALHIAVGGIAAGYHEAHLQLRTGDPSVAVGVVGREIHPGVGQRQSLGQEDPGGCEVATRIGMRVVQPHAHETVVGGAFGLRGRLESRLTV